jgi:hypothetical protein
MTHVKQSGMFDRSNVTCGRGWMAEQGRLDRPPLPLCGTR